jgi:general secretion pathway protein G
MKNSFTLIELIVVIAIIAVLAAIIAPNAFRAIEKAKISSLESDVKTFKSVLYAYYVDTGAWPKGIATDPACMGCFIYGSEPSAPYLMENTENVFGWDGPYIEKMKLSPWGTWYTFANEQTAGGNSHGCNPPGIDITLHINDDPNSRMLPRESMLKIDRDIDDGNLTTGKVVESNLEVGQLVISVAEIGKW